jgi:superfamily II DNA/RNA helicase
MSAYGGTNINRQIQQLAKCVDVVIACPGRLRDLIDRKALTLGDVETVVVDEADRMADMGFLPEVRKLLDLTSSRRQTLLFSATLDGDVATLTRDYQNNPVRHEVGPSTPDVGSMTHFFWEVDRSERVEQATKVIRNSGKTVVFVRTRHGVDRVTKQLKRSGVEAVAIHGARSQSQRDRSLKQFTDGQALALIATDVAARGLHIDDVSCVLHFDPPEDHKAYLHRSGRTARAGATGVVVSFVDRSQHKSVKLLQRKLGLQVPLSKPAFEELSDSSPKLLTTKFQNRNNDSQNSQTERPQKGKQTNSSNNSAGQKRNRKPQGKKSHSTTSKHRNGQRTGPAGRANSHNRSSGNSKKRSHSNKARSHR